MKNEHVINLIEGATLAELGENDLAAIRAHADNCSKCRDAFQAAEVSALLLKERAAVEFEPSPFFHTRVMATLRERQAVGESWSWSRMWRAAGALASSMVATVAALAVLTFAIPGTQHFSPTQQGSSSHFSPTQQPSSSPNGYSAEEVILDQISQLEGESDGQLLTTIYGSEEEAR